MHIHSKITGTRGFVIAYNEALRFRDMITPKATERARILAFWHAHGLTAAQDAFKVSKATLYRWQELLDEGEGELEALVPFSTAPQHTRKRVIPKAVAQLILEERAHERVGKEKLAKLLIFEETGNPQESEATLILGKNRPAHPETAKENEEKAP